MEQFLQDPTISLDAGLTQSLSHQWNSPRSPVAALFATLDLTPSLLSIKSMLVLTSYIIMVIHIIFASYRARLFSSLIFPFTSNSHTPSVNRSPLRRSNISELLQSLLVLSVTYIFSHADSASHFLFFHVFIVFTTYILLWYFISIKSKACVCQLSSNITFPLHTSCHRWYNNFFVKRTSSLL